MPICSLNMASNRVCISRFAGNSMKTVSEQIRLWRLLRLWLLACTAWAMCLGPAHAADRTFAKRFSINKAGDILIVGNTLMTCPGSCPTVQNGTSATLNNNNYSMAYVNTEGGAFLNSSRADLNLPAGAYVEWAGLYWGGQSANAAKNQARFITPLSDSNLTSTVVDTGSANANRYQAFVDVTNLVRAAGSGSYVTGNVQSTPNTSDVYASWSLVVVYSNPSEQARNLTVFDGLASVSSTAVNVAVGPFISPPSGAVNARIGVVAYEGDASTTGDVLKFNGTKSSPASSGTQVILSDACHPANNSFNSSICRLGQQVNAKTPNFVNQMGVDMSVFSLNNTGNSVIRNGDDGANINLSTTGDAYLAGVLISAIDVYLPNLSAGITKTMTDLNGGLLVAGDVVEYALQFNNTGNDYADATVVNDPIPANTTYVPGSLQVSSGANTGGKTDALGDDQCDFQAATPKVVCRIGTGANGMVGGTLAPGDNSTVKFRVQVNASTPNGTSISNTANVTYTARTVAQTYTVSTNQAASATGPTDLTVSATHTGNFQQGQQGAQYRLSVSNSGAATTSAFQVVDTLPSGVTFVSGSGSGWTCTAIGQQVTCSNDNASPLGGGGSSMITLVVNVASTASGTLINSAVVSGGGDSTAANNTASDPTTITPTPDFVIAKTHAGNFAQGQTGKTYTLTVSNQGGATSSGTVTVVDTLPTGLTATAMAGTGWVCTLATLTCTRGDALAASGSYPAITLTVSVAANALGPINNVASVSGGGQANTSNDTVSDATVINTSTPDLTIAKSHVGDFNQGQTNASYSVVVGNSGLQATSGTVTVVDAPPTGMTVTALGGTGWSCTLASKTCTRNDVLAAGATYPTVTVTVAVADAAGATLTNTATVSGGSEPVGNNGNNSSADVTTVRPSSDLIITKAAINSFAQGQANAQYRISVSNVGNAPTAGTVTMVDTWPSALNATAISGTGWACQLATLTCTRSDSLATSSAYPDIIITATVPGNAPASVTNAATVSGGGQFKTSNDTVSVNTTIAPSPDLSLVKSHVGTFVRGSQGVYRLTVSNTGSVSSMGTVTVSDTLPAGLSATAMVGVGWTCSAASGTCSRSDALAPAASYPDIVLTVSVAQSAAAVLVNQAQVSGGGDVNAANNLATDTTGIESRADVQATLTAPAAATPGTQIIYSIVLTNAGPSDAAAVQVSDPTPSGLVFVSNAGGCASAFPCDLGTLAANASTTITATFSVPAGYAGNGSIVNTVNASTSTTDPATGNNQATASSQVSGSSGGIADLAVAISNGATTVVPGSSTTYVISVSNAGPNAANGTRVVDAFPADITGVSWTCAASGGAVCSAASGTGDIGSLVDLPAGGSVMFTATGQISPSATGTLSNSASAVLPAGVSDPTSNNNTDSDTLTPQVDLAVSLSAANSAVPGGNLVYTLRVDNAGPSNAESVVANMATPSGLVWVSNTGACMAAFPCSWSPQAPNSQRTITVTYQVPNGYSGPTPIQATATVSTSTAEVATSNNSATTNTTVGANNYNLSGKVFADANHSGYADSGETGTGLTLFAKLVSSASPAGPAQSAAAVDSSTGVYLFINLPAGDYRVLIDDNSNLSDVTPASVAGWTPTSVDGLARGPLRLSTMDRTGVDFGLFHGQKVQGRVFQDDGRASGTANNLVQDGAEMGLTGVAMQLAHSGGQVLQTTLTGASGDYLFWVPSSLYGQPLMVQEINPPGWRSIGAQPLAQYQAAADALSITVTTAGSVSGLNFADVPGQALVSDTRVTVAPGSVVFFLHQWTAGTAGTVSFTTSTDRTWPTSLLLDSNCNGQIDVGEGPAGTYAVLAGARFCLIERVQVPAGTPPGLQATTQVSATWADSQSWGGALEPVATVRDITAVVALESQGPLALQKSQSQSSVAPGSTVAYRIDVSNTGLASLSNIQINDMTPAHTVFVSATCLTPLPPGLQSCAVVSAPAVDAAGALQWSLNGPLSAGSVATVVFTVRIP